MQLYLVHPGAVHGFGTVLESALMVDVVHGSGREFRVVEFVVGWRIFQTASPVSVKESGDVLARAVGPNDRPGVRTELRRHDMLITRQRLAAISRSVVIGSKAVRTPSEEIVKKKDRTVIHSSMGMLKKETFND